MTSLKDKPMRVPFSLSAVAAAVVALASGYVAWAQQPAPPEAVWTPTSDAPKGLLTALEGEHHDRFIGRARAGDIDIVFFGSTETEMWLWPDRGRSVWDKTFGSLKAADFGTQGTRFESLMWRMRNGELNGYRAKLVVLQAQGDDDTNVRNGSFEDYVANYAAIIAEVRARQPQAKILLFGSFPRSRTHTGLLGNAALARLANNETVFFIDISDRFFRPDGSHNSGMWGSGVVGPGIQRPAFEVWAEVLQPWLDRFVR
jgi:GDSL-like Lipase/Acylhydrolase family